MIFFLFIYHFLALANDIFGLNLRQIEENLGVVIWISGFLQNLYSKVRRLTYTHLHVVYMKARVSKLNVLKIRNIVSALSAFYINEPSQKNHCNLKKIY